MEHNTYRCKVSYRGDEVGERGREWVTVTKQRNGQRTMQAQCEIDDTAVLRDVTMIWWSGTSSSTRGDWHAG